MLNYVWISLLLIGIFVAAGRDINDEVQNTYRNGVPLTAEFVVNNNSQPLLNKTLTGEIVISASSFNQFYNSSSAETEIRQPVIFSTLPSGKQKLEIKISDATPQFWKEMAKAAGGKEKLEADVQSFDAKSGALTIIVEKIHFVKIKAVTKAALEYADIAVTISLGLIGVMALWLGIMKVAEAAGLLLVLTKIMTPVTKRLFPDVPPDHPAVGSMIMNIAANMLGLNNAATPLGLKAMEELNKLSPKAGVATNAMCTFLAINTGGLVLIPATAIAIRAGLNSADPGMIIGTSIIGAGTATVAGIIAAKLLQRMPVYRKALEVTEEEKNNG